MEQPRQDVQNVFERSPSEGSLPLAVVGAAAGAAFGGVAWFLIEYFAHVQAGFIAILSGLAAGFGALLLGKRPGLTIGVIAAVFGLLGVVGGSYGSFRAQKADVKDELAEQMRADPAFEALSPGEQEQILALARATVEEFGYVDYLKGDTKNLAWMAVFGLIGLAYGFKIGNGGLGDEPEPGVAA